jgi:2-oxoglutarate dehydrogenase E2 component (dihydrolipoamide succinyltransferase)
VKVPPWRSETAIVPSRALTANPPIVFSISAKLIRSASRITGTITVDELQGGTFTITNGGIFGSLLSTPILNPPQSAILGMHAIKKRAVVVDDQIVIRPMMYLALSYDHRIIDGREAVSFLVRIKECLEDPERMMLGL